MAPTTRIDAAIGIMDPAYFRSRTEILDFFNSTLDMSLTKIEQTATGAVHCQLLSMMFPRSVPMNRVSWEARSQHEYAGNYKLLQAAFDRNRIQRHIDVDKLIQAKYMDNMEFCQWIYAFCQQMGRDVPEGYDPVAARARGKGGKRLPAHFLPRGQTRGAAAAKKAGGGRATRPGARVPHHSPRPTRGGGGGGPRASSSSAANQRPSSASSPSSRGVRVPYAVSTKENAKAPPAQVGRNASHSRSPAKPRRKVGRSRSVVDGPGEGGGAAAAAAASAAAAAAAAAAKENSALSRRNEELEASLAEAEMAAAEIEAERDFYFEKLRGIEVMLQVHEEGDLAGRGGEQATDEVIAKIFRVLYAAVEDGLTVGDEGELLGGRDDDDDDNDGEEGELPSTQELDDEIEVSLLESSAEGDEDLLVREAREFARTGVSLLDH